MKRFYIIWLFLSLIISSCFLILFTEFTKADIQNSDKYIFKQNTIYNEVNQNGITPNYYYNLRNREYYTQNYSATFSFDNDIGLENEIIPFVSNIPNSASAKVLESYDNHYSVLELNTTVNGENIFCNFDFYNLGGSPQADIEFWLYTNNTDKNKCFALFDDNLGISYFYLANDGNYYGADGIPTFDTGFPYYANNWTHHRIAWKDDNTYSWWINGRLIANWKSFNNNMIHGINRIMFYNYDDSIFYIDAFVIDDAMYEGIPNYDVDDNNIPEIIELNDYEIDKFEFDYDNEYFRNNNTPFKYIETNNKAFSINKLSDIDNRLKWSGSVDNTPYEDKIDLELNNTGYIFNITFLFNLIQVKDSQQRFYFYVYNYDDNNDIVQNQMFYIDDTKQIRVYDWLDGTADYQQTGLDYNEGEIADLNIYLNYYDNLGKISVNGSTYNFNLRYGYHGIQQTRMLFQKNSNTYSSIIELFNYGVYENGSSLVKDVNELYSNEYQQSGYSLYQLHDNYYYPITYYHLLDYDILVNECTIYNYDDYQNYKDTLNIFERNNYTEKVNYNLIDNWTYIYSFLIFEYYINISYPTFINNEGIKLEANIYQNYELNIETYYISDYYYINTDTENNYFYAKNDKLYYNFNKTNSGKNYMSISFEIDSYLIDDDYGIAYNSYITKNYTGILTLDYDIGSNSYFTINKSNSVKYSEYNLTNQNGYYLEQINIQISNDDITDVSGYTDGYIDSLNFGSAFYFVDIDDIDNTLLDLEFVEAIIYVIIILIMIIIPCYILYERLGKKVIIPMLMLITLVLMISSFLPIWLGIIILFSGLLFIYHQSKEGVSND